MKKIFLVVIIMFTFCICKAQQTFWTPGVPPGSTSFSASFRFSGTDSLANLYFSNGNKWWQAYTSTQANLRFLKKSDIGGISILNQNSAPQTGSNFWIDGIGQAPELTGSLTFSGSNHIYDLSSLQLLFGADHPDGSSENSAYTTNQLQFSNGHYGVIFSIVPGENGNLIGGVKTTFTDTLRSSVTPIDSLDVLRLKDTALIYSNTPIYTSSNGITKQTGNNFALGGALDATTLISFSVYGMGLGDFSTQKAYVSIDPTTSNVTIKGGGSNLSLSSFGTGLQTSAGFSRVMSIAIDTVSGMQIVDQDFNRGLIHDASINRATWTDNTYIDKYYGDHTYQISGDTAGFSNKFIKNTSTLQPSSQYNVSAGTITNGTQAILNLAKTGTSARTWAISGGTLSATGFTVKNVTDNKTAMYITSDGETRFGSATNITANGSRMYLFGGINGANLDAQGDSTLTNGDQATFEAESADYATTAKSIAIRYFGRTLLSPSTFLGITAHDMGVLDFGQDGTSIIRNDTTNPILIGINDTEVARFTTEGISTKSVSITGISGSGVTDYIAQSSTPATPATGHQIVYADANGRWSIMGNNGFSASISKSLLTASRIYNLPDSAGTIALESRKIPNASLVNSTISGISLGANLAALTNGVGVSSLSYNGSSSLAVNIDTASTIASKTFATRYAAINSSPSFANITLSSAINKVTITPPATSATITIADGAQFKTVGAFLSQFTFPASTNATVPSGTHTLAIKDAAQTFTGVQTFTAPVFTDGGATAVASMGTGSGTNYLGFSSNRAMFGYNSTTTNSSITSGSSKGFEIWVASGAGTFGAGINALTISAAGNTSLTGNLSLGTAGNKINIATGSNASVGTATLVAGTVTVSTTAVTSSSKIFLTDATTGALTNIGTPTVGTIVNGTSFVINSSNILDTSNINWLIIN